ncbi:MAG: porin [bacterium]
MFKPLSLSIALSLTNLAMADDKTEIDALKAQLSQQQMMIEKLQKSIIDTRQKINQINNNVEQVDEKVELVADNQTNFQTSKQSQTILGGYGEIHINQLEDQNTGNEKNSIDFHRFVLFAGHQFSDKIRFYSELEVEHAIIEGEDSGEVAVEQAFVEWDMNNQTSMKAGMFLTPVGFINETHEPPTFYGTERNPVEKHIIPTTWREGGLAVNGILGKAWSYDLAVHSGLKVSSTKNFTIRKGRQGVAKAQFDDAAITGRLRWSGIPGLEAAVSIQHQFDITQSLDPNAGAANLFEGQIAWSHGPFALKALYAQWQLDGSAPKSVGADEQSGYYIEPAYRINEQWGVFARYNQWDNQAGDNLDSEYRQFDLGVNYWIHPQVVFKLDYQNQSSPDGKSEFDGFNIGVGYQF